MKTMNLYHALAYVGGLALMALAWLAVQPPAEFQFLGPKAAAVIAGLIGVAASIVAYAHQSGWMPSSKASVTTIAKVFLPLAVVLPLMGGCATTGGKLAVPTLTTAQLQAVTKSVCTTLNADVAVLEGPTGQTLLASNPTAQKQISTVIGPDIAAVCASGAAVDVTSLQTIVNTVLPAITAVVASVPQIPDQAEILAGLTAAQLILVPVVNQLIDLAPAASSAPSSAPAASVPAGAKVTDVPAQAKHFALASIETPQAVGAAASLVIVSSLQAFDHVTVNAPTAAALTVLLRGGRRAT
ncbi:MAG TPA: hypothetical protein VMF03_00200 [Steroidobacteraceae bacterium]|nr:hypothetical protein [Steroidobacteraceae bacterium]